MTGVGISPAIYLSISRPVSWRIIAVRHSYTFSLTTLATLQPYSSQHDESGPYMRTLPAFPVASRRIGSDREDESASAAERRPRQGHATTYPSVLFRFVPAMYSCLLYRFPCHLLTTTDTFRLSPLSGSLGILLPSSFVLFTELTMQISATESFFPSVVSYFRHFR
jgi:hypothetical protein